MHLKHTILSILLVYLYSKLVFTYDLYEGYDFGARMSYKEVKKHGLLFFVREETLLFKYPPGTYITGISVVDITPDKSGTPNILAGGVGKDFVQIHLESARSHGLRFIVEIYAPAFTPDLGLGHTVEDQGRKKTHHREDNMKDIRVNFT